MKTTAYAWDLPALKLFWHWIAERQRIFYRRKVVRHAPPWTTDPVLRDNHFTNVYRELDPGTSWLVRRVLENRYLTKRDKAFVALAYRLFGTEAVFDELGIDIVTGPRHPMLPLAFDKKWVATKLQNMMDEGRQAFTPAYMVSNYGRPEPKPIVIADILSRAAAHWENTARMLFDTIDRPMAHAVLSSVHGIGNFIAFQTLVDLCYPLECEGGQGLLPFDNDGWVSAGPGAVRGLQILLPSQDSFKRGVDNTAIAWLVKEQAHPLNLRGMHWLVDRHSKPILVNRSNMQNCLCEFSKYCKLLDPDKTGGRKRRFIDAVAHANDLDHPATTLRLGGAAVQTDLIEELQP